MVGELLLLSFLLLIIGSIGFYTLKLGISPMPTFPNIRSLMIGLLPQDIDGVIYDLGSGWGSLVFSLADQHLKNRVIGFELSPVPWAASKLRWIFSPHSNLNIRREDFFQADLKDAGLIVCYLYPGAMMKLKTKLEAELKPGTLVLSHYFSMPGWKPLKVITAAESHRSRVFLYRI